ncbi:MAG: PstS family phosphate ABC transporter substrate-binding protein [Armatimonadetes bacterium]|nr:PstS family phosphate ABC transporter substrate-binding protein [Armatimonadota bacterium]MDW8121920.1 PstS family phosphate ABC transporter substrate-binding protein [Armatimonadota bacterium]
MLRGGKRRSPILVGVAIGLLMSVGLLAALSAEMIRIDGSSTVFPITEAVAEEFRKAHPDIQVTVGISGTGGGFKRFSRGETDISNASRPIREVEDKACRENGIQYIELPVAFDALSVVVNPSNNWVTSLTVEELKKIWEPDAKGKIVRWSQVRAGFPDRPLRLYGAGTDSGTFDFFTEAIVGKERASRSDYTASEDDNVLVQGVMRDADALGYFGFAYYWENRTRLKAVAIQCNCHNDGKPSAPSFDSVLKNQYHLARPLFIYVSSKSADRPAVQTFVHFYLRTAPKLVKEVGYVPLTPRLYQLARNRFNKRIYGSVFGLKGAQVGVSLESLLAAEEKGK